MKPFNDKVKFNHRLSPLEGPELSLCDSIQLASGRALGIINTLAVCFDQSRNQPTDDDVANALYAAAAEITDIRLLVEAYLTAARESKEAI